MWKRKETQIQTKIFLPVLGGCFLYTQQFFVSLDLQLNTATSYLSLWASAPYLDQLHISGRKYTAQCQHSQMSFV